MYNFYLKDKNLYFENGRHLGEILMDEDGYYKWWPDNHKGYLDELFLISLGNFLKEMNKDWDDTVNFN